MSPLRAAGLDDRSQLVPIYDMTDGVTDEQFESALTEAKAEGNHVPRERRPQSQSP